MASSKAFILLISIALFVFIFSHETLARELAQTNSEASTMFLNRNKHNSDDTDDQDLGSNESNVDEKLPTAPGKGSSTAKNIGSESSNTSDQKLVGQGATGTNSNSSNKDQVAGVTKQTNKQEKSVTQP